MFAACQHAYLSPLKLNLCSNGMDHGTRHIQSCLLLHSPTNASMHDRCIRRYLKFRRLCLSPCFLHYKNLSNGQFMIQGQFQILFHSSLINSFKKKQKSTKLPRTKALIVHGTKLNTNFLLKCLTISAKFMFQLKIWQLE